MKAPQSRKPYTKVAADVSGLFQEAKGQEISAMHTTLITHPNWGVYFGRVERILQSMGVNRDHAAVTKLGRFHEGYEGRR